MSSCRGAACVSLAQSLSTCMGAKGVCKIIRQWFLIVVHSRRQVQG
jgi:hypothetical protein